MAPTAEGGALSSQDYGYPGPGEVWTALAIRWTRAQVPGSDNPSAGLTDSNFQRHCRVLMPELVPLHHT